MGSFFNIGFLPNKGFVNKEDLQWRSNSSHRLLLCSKSVQYLWPCNLLGRVNKCALLWINEQKDSLLGYWYFVKFDPLRKRKYRAGHAVYVRIKSRSIPSADRSHQTKLRRRCNYRPLYQVVTYILTYIVYTEYFTNIGWFYYEYSHYSLNDQSCKVG